MGGRLDPVRPALPHRRGPGARTLARGALPADREAQAMSRARQKRRLLAEGLVPRDYDDLWHLRAYWRAIRDAVNGPLDATACNPVMDAKYRSLAANGVVWCDGQTLTDPSAVKTWFSQRRAALQLQLAAVAARENASSPRKPPSMFYRALEWESFSDSTGCANQARRGQFAGMQPLPELRWHRDHTACG